MKEPVSAEVQASCRACLVQRRSLRSLFQHVGPHTYAHMLGVFTNVKILPNDGLSDRICPTCRRKTEEAFEFKSLVEQSDKLLKLGSASTSGDTSIKKFIFNDISEVKVEIDFCKVENIVETNAEDVKTVKLDFEDGKDEIPYNNTMIKKLIKTTSKTIHVDEFIKNIKHELPDSNGDDIEDDYFDDWKNDDDEEYFPPGANDSSAKALVEKTTHTKKRKKGWNKYKNSEDEQKNNNQKINGNPKMRKEKIKPIYLEDISLVPAKPRPYPRKPRKKTAESRGKASMCAHCGKVTKSIKSHMLIHTGERKFKCTTCPKAFYTGKLLEHHMKIHTGIKDFKCDKCQAEFFDKGRLNSHMHSHKEVRDFICSVCSKGFRRKTTLKRHVLRHSSANKTVKCELCNMSFFEKGQLKAHMRIHTGERPYKCELCSQPYSYKHDFNRHCFKKHGVYMKRRLIRVMNEEVLQRERAAVKDVLDKRYQGETMVRSHVKKRDGPGWNHETLQQALAVIRSEGLTFYAASKRFGIPRATLFDHMTGRRRHKSNSLRGPTALTLDTEKTLATCIRTMEKNLL